MSPFPILTLFAMLICTTSSLPIITNTDESLQFDMEPVTQTNTNNLPNSEIINLSENLEASKIITKEKKPEISPQWDDDVEGLTLQSNKLSMEREVPKSFQFTLPFGLNLQQQAALIQKSSDFMTTLKKALDKAKQKDEYGFGTPSPQIKGANEEKLTIVHSEDPSQSAKMDNTQMNNIIADLLLLEAIVEYQEISPDDHSDETDWQDWDNEGDNSKAENTDDKETKFLPGDVKLVKVDSDGGDDGKHELICKLVSDNSRAGDQTYTVMWIIILSMVMFLETICLVCLTWDLERMRKTIYKRVTNIAVNRIKLPACKTEF